MVVNQGHIRLRSADVLHGQRQHELATDPRSDYLLQKCLHPQQFRFRVYPNPGNSLPVRSQRSDLYRQTCTIRTNRHIRCEEIPRRQTGDRLLRSLESGKKRSGNRPVRRDFHPAAPGSGDIFWFSRSRLPDKPWPTGSRVSREALTRVFHRSFTIIPKSPNRFLLSFPRDLISLPSAFSTVHFWVDK